MNNHYVTTPIMGIDFVNASMDSFLNRTIYPFLEEERKCFIVTANPEFVIRTRESIEFKQHVESADYVLPDGIGIINAAKISGMPLKERLSGVDVTHAMLEYAAQKGHSVFFLGAKKDSNQKAVENARKKFPGLIIAGYEHGYADITSEEFIASMVNSNPDIILVALGMERQEKWIYDNIDYFSKGIFIGVGGTLDVMSGNVKRAPQIWITLQLEWLYRLIQEPKRFLRILKVIKFMLLHVPIISKMIKITRIDK
ncbi:WecB/TagA/CpsF family glycosyltransferase [Salinicoccus jeotgali]|uniref:WecB/TagA/CpsF family glycosyltransferase n=1 Tax=Salinicoccus jeotgali TaxID=381634 RepID=A0ABP7F1C4_9STAP